MKNFLFMVALLFAVFTVPTVVKASELHGGVHVNEYVWDFAVSGGSSTVAIQLDALDGNHKLPVHATVTNFTAWVETAAVGASGTYSVGNASSSTAYMSSVAVATLVKDYVVSPAVVPYAITGSTLADMKLTIATTAASAGKIHFYVEYRY